MPTLAELAALLGGTVQGPAEFPVEGVASLEDAGARQITFLTDARLLPALAASRAGAGLMTAGAPVQAKPAIL
ncbi:MAG: LpxD N-terminal domain-containing protein, partial [bacterium]